MLSLSALPAAAEEASLARVGRVSAVDGGLALRPAGGEWGDSGVNDPIAAGMAARTAAQGRTVLRIGAETIALAAGSEAEFGQLDTSGTQVTLRRGRIGLRLSRLDPARSIEIDIPRGGVWLLTPGDYDITAGDERSPARIAVLDGRARFVGGGLDSAIAAPETLSLGSGNPLAETREDVVADDFDAWWRAAGGRADAEALHYVSAEMTGYERLDGNGTWHTVAGYGAAWFVAAEDWAPYRNGHWRWIAPWGWTWIDDMPWAFAPSHYGRWARLNEPDPLALTQPDRERWAWLPGKSAMPPLYAPALVSFLGTPGFGLSCPDAVGPAVAWFPLAPGEVYWPSYTTDPDTIRRLNAGALGDDTVIDAAIDGQPPGSVINADYANRRFAAVVPRAVFTGGRPIAPAVVQLPERRLENAPLLAGSPQLAPSMPRPAAAVAAVLANRNPVAGPKLATAVRTLARIFTPQRPHAVLGAVAHARLKRPAHLRIAAGGASIARVVAAVAPRTRPQLHFAARSRSRTAIR